MSTHSRTFATTGRRLCLLAIGASLAGSPLLAQTSTFKSADLYALKSIADVELSPDGRTIAYSIQNSDRPGRPYSQVWLMDVASGQSRRLGSDAEAASAPRWSHDGKRVAFFGRGTESEGFRADDRRRRRIERHVPRPRDGDEPSASVLRRSPHLVSRRQAHCLRVGHTGARGGRQRRSDGDHPLPVQANGQRRPDAIQRQQAAFISSSSTSRRRRSSSSPKATTTSTRSTGRPRATRSSSCRIAGPNPDRFFNYDLFAVKVADKSDAAPHRHEERRIPSPLVARRQAIAYQGTRRTLTSSETTMEDTHVWVMDASGQNRHEIGDRLDTRQGAPEWSADGPLGLLHRPGARQHALCIARGCRRHTARQSCAAQARSARGRSAPRGATAVRLHARRRGRRSYTWSGAGAGKPLTSLNDDAAARQARSATTEELTFKSFDGTEIGAYLTKPAGGPATRQASADRHDPRRAARRAGARVQCQDPGLRGHRLGDADGELPRLDRLRPEAHRRDLQGPGRRTKRRTCSRAWTRRCARYPWIDRRRGWASRATATAASSRDWLITQTDRFKAAIPPASISNLVSFNYMSYYHDYLAVEFGAFPHEQDLMDRCWQRSALSYVNKVQDADDARCTARTTTTCRLRRRSSSTSRCATSGSKPSWSAIRAKATASAKRSTSSTSPTAVSRGTRSTSSLRRSS